MIYVLAIVIAPLIIRMIWNGRHGRGYTLQLKLPPKGSKKRLPMQMILAAYTLVLFGTIFLSELSDSHNNGQGIAGAAFHSITLIADIWITILVVRMARDRYRKN